MGSPNQSRLRHRPVRSIPVHRRTAKGGPRARGPPLLRIRTGHRRRFDVDAVGERQPRTTLPAFRHEVHTLSLRTVPGPTWARTGWMFGFHRRCVRRCECETLIPKPGPLPHTSHTAATPNTTCQRYCDRHQGRSEQTSGGPTCAGQPPQGTYSPALHQITAEGLSLTSAADLRIRCRPVEAPLGPSRRPGRRSGAPWTA